MLQRQQKVYIHKHSKSFFLTNTCVNGNLTLSSTSDTIYQKSTLNILCQNVCGITKKRDAYEIYLEQLQQKQNIICLCEHFLNEKTIHFLHFENYDVGAFFARKQKIRGGSLILLQKGRRVEPIDCKRFSRIDCFEICGVKDLTTNIFIFCCYQNNANFKMFLERLELLLQHYFNKKVIICGDFNVNVLNEDDNSKKYFCTLIKSYKFRHLVNSITFKRNDMQSCIDNILTNMPQYMIDRVEVDHNGHSDGHAALLTSILTEGSGGKKWIEPVMIVKRRRFTKNNKENFRKRMLEQNWLTLGINSFLKVFTGIFCDCFKKTKVKLNLCKHNKIKWLTKGIRISSKMKRILAPVNKKKNK